MKSSVFISCWDGLFGLLSPCHLILTPATCPDVPCDVFMVGRCIMDVNVWDYSFCHYVVGRATVYAWTAADAGNGSIFLNIPCGLRIYINLLS